MQQKCCCFEGAYLSAHHEAQNLETNSKLAGKLGSEKFESMKRGLEIQIQS